MSSLALILESMDASGMCYFSGSDDKKYFRLSGGEVRELIHGRDDHPMMYQFSFRHPLAEPGRRFDSSDEAIHYADALAAIDSMILFAQISSSDRYSESLRQEAFSTSLQMQEKIKDSYLDVLETVEGFDSIRDFLYLKPDAISQKLMQS